MGAAGSANRSNAVAALPCGGLCTEMSLPPPSSLWGISEKTNTRDSLNNGNSKNNIITRFEHNRLSLKKKKKLLQKDFMLSRPKLPVLS